MTASCELVRIGATLPLDKRKRRRRVTGSFADMDVSIEETETCTVRDDGKVMLETAVATESTPIAKPLAPYAGRLAELGM